MEAVDKILAGKYPAKAHAKRVVEYLRTKTGGDVKGVLYLEGQKTKMIEDNDGEAPFRQRRYFYYLTGCELPDAYFTYDIATEKSTLFVPGIDAESVIWSGLPVSTSEALEKYDVDAAQTSEQLPAFLAAGGSAGTAWAIANQVSDHVSFLQFGATDFTLLKEAIGECRVVKDEYEVALIRKANLISTIAHTEVLKTVKRAKNERELEAVFLERCIAHGSREQAYHSIVAAGTAAATLHYVPNNKTLDGKLNVLLDAGGEYDCYASDIVCSSFFPSSYSPG